MFSSSLIQQYKLKALQQMAAHPNPGCLYAAHCDHIGDVFNRNIFEKFGHTEKPDPTVRVSQLQQEYKSLSPFVIDRAIYVNHVEAVERAFHEFFDDLRILSNREFFDVSDVKMQKMQMQLMNMLLMAAGGKECEPERAVAEQPNENELHEVLSELRVNSDAFIPNTTTVSSIRATKQSNQYNDELVHRARPKFQITKYNDLRVVTPELCYSPEKAAYPDQTLILDAFWNSDKNAFVDNAGREFAELSDFAKYHSEMLGWTDLARQAKTTGIIQKIVHKPGQIRGNHGPSYTSYGWRAFRYVNDNGELCPISEISYQVR